MPTRAKGGPVKDNAFQVVIEVPLGGFPLRGPSTRPDPRTHAYRKDLADAALAGTVIASHYADPLERCLSRTATLLAGPSEQSEPIVDLVQGDLLMMLDCSLGWAWGYAGPNRLVGYLPFSAL